MFQHGTISSRAIVVVFAFLAASVWPTAGTALADPVAECQASTTNQVETTQCLSDTLDAAQQVMQMALERAQEKADGLDQVTGRVEARPALDASQAEWTKFRDLNCKVPFTFAAGASGAGQFQAGCAIQMTRARTEELSTLASGG